MKSAETIVANVFSIRRRHIATIFAFQISAQQIVSGIRTQLPGGIMELSVGLERAHALPRGRAAQTRRTVGAQGKAAGSRNAAKASRLTWFVYCAALVGLLYLGWLNRNERHWVPETGVGYWLGIAGAIAMLALLLYPFRKRFRALRFLGSVPVWFRLHMALGLLGPSLILLHCNFRSKSLNASVALNAMLIVAGSGLIGRFLYTHVHSTLSGKRMAATSFFEEAGAGTGLDASNANFGLSPQALARVSAVTQQALASPKGLIAAIGHASLVRWQTRQLARALKREIRARNAELIRTGALPRRQIRQARHNFEQAVAGHLAAVRKATGLAIYERLFSLWHFLHLPLFLMLVIAAIVHVIAVHLY